MPASTCGYQRWAASTRGSSRRKAVRVEGQFTCNDVDMIAEAAIDGLGLCCLPDDHLVPLIAAGRLQPVLEDWSPSFPGYHLSYPSRRQPSRPFNLLVDALRWRG